MNQFNSVKNLLVSFFFQENNLLELPVDDGTNYLNGWNTRRTIILNKYTTGEKLTIVSSFLPGGEKSKHSYRKGVFLLDKLESVILLLILLFFLFIYFCFKLVLFQLFLDRYLT